MRPLAVKQQNRENQKMNKIPRPLLILVLLTALIICTPLALPYNKFIPDIQAILGKQIPGKLDIGNISFRYTPFPSLIIERVRLSKPEAISIEKITLPISLRLLASAGKDMGNIRLENITASPRVAFLLSNRPTSTSSEHIRIRKADLINASITTKHGTLGPANGTLEFKPDGVINLLTIQSADNNAALQVQPTNAPETLDIQFSAKDWQLPSGHPVKFDAIRLVGKITADSLLISEARASLYGGVISGNARLDWRKRLALTGKMEASGLKAESLIGLFSSDTKASGQLAGDGSFTFEADQLQQLFDTPNLRGRFVLREGTLYNIDLAAPLRSADPEQKRQGGQTGFSLFRGNISIHGKVVALSGLTLESGKLRAQGEATLREGKLSGGVTTTLANGNILAGTHISLEGSLARPELKSGGAWRPSLAPTDEPQ